jgi:hypothetical protein
MESPPGLTVVLEDDGVGTVPGAFRSRSHGRVGLHVRYLPLERPGETGFS